MESDWDIRSSDQIGMRQEDLLASPNYTEIARKYVTYQWHNGAMRKFIPVAGKVISDNLGGRDFSPTACAVADEQGFVVDIIRVDGIKKED